MNDTERGEKIGTWLRILATDDHEKWAGITPELCEEVLTGTTWSKEAAIGIIERIGREIPIPGAVSALAAGLNNEDFSVWSAAARALKSISHSRKTDLRGAMPAIVQSASGEWQRTYVMIEILGAIGSNWPIPDAMDTLIRALELKETGIRNAAAKAIGDIARTTSTAKAMPKLVEMLSEGVDDAATALVKIGEPEVLFSALCNCALKHAHGWERTSEKILGALMKIGAMSEVIVLLGHENERIRELCAQILLRTGDERAERFGRIIYGCRKTTGLKLSDHKDIEYAAGLGLEIIAETQREFFVLIRGRYPEERILEMKRQFAAFYARVAEQICGRKKDVPMEDTELARRARKRMEKLKEKNRPKQTFRALIVA